MICLCSKRLKFFRTSKYGLNSDYFAKIAHKIAKSKYLPDILNDSDSPINSLSVICCGNLSLSKIIGGWCHPAPPHPFILQNCVKVVHFSLALEHKLPCNSFASLNKSHIPSLPAALHSAIWYRVNTTDVVLC